MRLRRRLLNTLLALAAIGLLAPSAAAARVPAGWLGVNIEAGLLLKHGRLDSEMSRIASVGGRTVRVAIYWSMMQPSRGAPIDFRAMDQLATSAARHRVALIPVLLDAPRWAAAPNPAPVARPQDPADFARFAATLVGRYGGHGTFWAAHRGVRRAPIRTWQVWNEVSNPWDWGSGWATEYPPLLRASYDAIKAADPGATVLMSGLNTGGGAGVNPQTSWSVMEQLYQQLDAQGLGRPFDVAAVHIYTRRVGDAVRVIEETRRVMARYGDAARPLRVTELAWPAAQGHLRHSFFAATTDRGMAQRLKQGIRMLAARRIALHIAGVDWFQWSSSYSGTDDPFRYSGLRRAKGRRTSDKPALAAYRSVARLLSRR